MPKIEFLYEQTCPNVADARAVLRAALAQAGLPVRWQEWERSDPAAPGYARRYGSPTILVDGQDVAGEPPNDEPSCRIYAAEPGRHRGVPSVALIMKALQPDRPSRTGVFAFLPAAGAALLPKLSCPACWPAYAALLSSLGVGFVDYTPWLFPATVVFLVFTLALLAWRPRQGSWPLALGLGASAVILIGKFAFDSDIVVYAGVTLLAAASLWNAWPQRQTACPACVEKTVG
jgi:mercuric ion transport protein